MKFNSDSRLQPPTWGVIPETWLLTPSDSAIVTLLSIKFITPTLKLTKDSAFMTPKFHYRPEFWYLNSGVSLKFIDSGAVAGVILTPTTGPWDLLNVVEEGSLVDKHKNFKFKDQS